MPAQDLGCNPVHLPNFLAHLGQVCLVGQLTDGEEHARLHSRCHVRYTPLLSLRGAFGQFLGRLLHLLPCLFQVRDKVVEQQFIALASDLTAIFGVTGTSRPELLFLLPNGLKNQATTDTSLIIKFKVLGRMLLAPSF